MRGPIRAPILLLFGNRNTPAEPHRAVPCAAKPGLLRLALPCRALPSRAEPADPCLAAPSHACDDVHRQALPTRPATPYPARPCHACLSLPPSPGHVHAKQDGHADEGHQGDEGFGRVDAHAKIHQIRTAVRATIATGSFMASRGQVARRRWCKAGHSSRTRRAGLALQGCRRCRVRDNRCWCIVR